MQLVLFILLLSRSFPSFKSNRTVSNSLESRREKISLFLVLLFSLASTFASTTLTTTKKEKNDNKKSNDQTNPRRARASHEGEPTRYRPNIERQAMKFQRRILSSNPSAYLEMEEYAPPSISRPSGRDGLLLERFFHVRVVQFLLQIQRAT